MGLRIDQDKERFRQIVRGRVRRDLKKYISQDNLIGRKGKDTVSIPIPQIDTPIFRYDDQQKGGTGQGEGDAGDPIGGQGQGKPGKGKAGQGEGEHVLEVEMTMDELADILSEELELPNIENKGKAKILSESTKYRTIRRQGPEGLRNFKRTYKEALKREISSGTYVPGRAVIPRKEDKRYRASDQVPEEITNAVIIYMMDVSGSMGDEQKEIVRIESFWIDTWLRSNYKGLETRYIIHDAVAREVDRETFFHTRESGGTMISSAYKLCKEMMDADYDTGSWNIYPFHFSDGDNWSADDTRACITLLKGEVLPRVNQFSYGQVESPYGSGQFIKDLRESFDGVENVALSEIANKDAIYNSIKEFLGKGS